MRGQSSAAYTIAMYGFDFRQAQGGRPQIETDLRARIRRMSIENPLWGAPRIHGELLKLGFVIAQSSVAKYMVQRRGPPSQGWRTFLRNHALDITAMDLCVVPTVGFDLLYAFVIVRLDRRDSVWINVTTNPTAEWIARQRIRLRKTSFGIGIESTSPSSRAEFAPWASRQAHCTGVALAEWLCRTADLIDSARVRGPFHHLG